MIPYRLAADTFGPEEIAAAKAVLDSGRLTMGLEVAAFEREFAAYVGAPHAIMVNSGSSANLIAVDVMLRRSFGEARLKPGDGVLVPALAWPTTVWPLAQLGLVPYFVDIDPNTLAIDLDSAAEMLDEQCKAMFLIHVLGQAAPLDAYADFCARHGLVLLEDACESLGAHSGRAHVGTVGAVGTFSFYYSHHLSTIEGGMVVTTDPGLADDLRSLRAHGWVRDRADRSTWTAPAVDDRFYFVMPGYNLRPMEIQGAIGRVQLRRLEVMLTARRSLAHLVRGWLPEWLQLIGLQQGYKCSWMTLPLRLVGPGAPPLAVVKRHLEAHGVETRPIIAGNLTAHPAIGHFTHRRLADLGDTDRLAASGFMIGCHPVVSNAALETLHEALVTLGDA